MIRSSSHRTTAIAVGPNTVRVRNVGDLVVGDPVCIYDAIPTTPSMSEPPTPNIVISGSGEERSYQCRYITAERAFGPVSSIFTAQPDDMGNVVLEWALGTLDSAAKWVLVYRSIGRSAYEPIGAAVCNPRGGDVFAEFRTSVLDNGSSDYLSRSLPGWFLSVDDAASDRGRLRTSITEVSGNELTLADSVDPGLSDGVLAHDAGQAIESALSTGDDVELESGIFQCHGDLIIEGNQQELKGQDLRRGELTSPKASELVFEDGDGLIIRGKSVVMERLTISQRASRTLPPLNLTLPQRPKEGEDFWVHGAALLCESRTFLRSVSVFRCRGIGIAVIAKAGGIGNNANLCAWSDVTSNQHTGHGFFLDGSDANASVFSSLNTVGNGGWGILDESLLGNAYIAPHASANQLGAYRIDSSANRSVLSYAYVESGQGESQLGPGVLVLGGPLGSWQGGGHVLGGNGFKEWVRLGSTYKTSFGHHKDEFQKLLRRYDSSDLRHHRHVLGDGVIEDYAATVGYSSRRWHGPHLRGYGLMEFPRGVLIGDVMLRAVDPDNLPTGTYDVGDLCIDKNGGLPLRPSEAFGIGSDWQDERIYRVGDVIAPGDGYAYVCSSMTGEFGGQSGSIRPTWAETVEDSNVTWTRWGGDSAKWVLE